MPTYTLKTSNIKLDKKKKTKIAQAITKVHNKITGANSYFAQVIFVNNKKKDDLSDACLQAVSYIRTNIKSESLDNYNVLY